MSGTDSGSENQSSENLRSTIDELSRRLRELKTGFDDPVRRELNAQLENLRRMYSSSQGRLTRGQSPQLGRMGGSGSGKMAQNPADVLTRQEAENERRAEQARRPARFRRGV